MPLPHLPGRARPRDPRSLVYGVTSGLSAWALFPGQFAFMAEQGWHVTVVADGDDLLERAGRREGVRTIPLRMEREISPREDVRSLLAWVRLLRVERPAVLNLGTPKASLLGMIAGALTGVPRRVYLVHGLRFEGARGAKRRVLLVMEWLTVRCATDVVVVSPSAGRVMIDNGLGARPLRLVGSGSCNGVDAADVRRRAGTVTPREVRVSLDVTPDRFVVVFVGRLVMDKGVGVLRESLRALAQAGVPATLLVVGDSESQEASAILADPELDVRLTGWVDDPSAYVSAADVLVLPTRREGYPTVVLEANACGVPVVTTRATGAVDSVVDGETGLLVDVDDARQLAAALERLARDPALRERLAARAEERVRHDFAPERLWRGLESIHRGRPSSDVTVVTA